MQSPLQNAAWVVVSLLICFLAGPLAFAALAWVLPARRRRGGPRQTGRLLAAAFFAGSALSALGLLAVMALPAYSGGALGGAGLRVLAAPMLALTAGLAVAGWRVRRQRRAHSASALAAADTRAPMPYLREFRHERQPFVSGPAELLRPYLRSVGGPAVGLEKPRLAGLPRAPPGRRFQHAGAQPGTAFGARLRPGRAGALAG